MTVPHACEHCTCDRLIRTSKGTYCEQCGRRWTTVPCQELEELQGAVQTLKEEFEVFRVAWTDARRS